MIYAFDLDNTLVKTDKTNYEDCEPIKERIEVVNRLYDLGNEIIIYTARGCRSGLTCELISLTEKQINKFGIKYNRLEMGKKIHFDILIDDKAENADVWFKNNMFTKPGIIAGNFDIIHPGYIKMFEDTKKICNKLIIFLHTDPNIDRPEKLKPILSIEDRISLLSSIKYIDEIIPYNNEKELENLLTKYTPHIRILGSDYKNKKFTGDSIVGNEVYFHERNHEWSTTKYKQKIAESLKSFK